MNGNRSDLSVPEGNAECQRINSVYVQPAIGGFFEFGWLIGWSNCAGYTSTFYHEATAFAWWETTTGHAGCRVFENQKPAGGQHHNFRASDTNANTYWGSWLNGNELQPNGVDLDFSQGIGAIGMERGDDADSGFTDFQDSDEYHQSNQWTDWDALTLDQDNDPDYHLRVDTGDAGSTVQ